MTNKFTTIVGSAVIGATLLAAGSAGDAATVELEPKRQPQYSYQEGSVVKQGPTIKFTGTTTLHNTTGMGAAIGGYSGRPSSAAGGTDRHRLFPSEDGRPWAGSQLGQDRCCRWPVGRGLRS